MATFLCTGLQTCSTDSVVWRHDTVLLCFGAWSLAPCSLFLFTCSMIHSCHAAHIQLMYICLLASAVTHFHSLRLTLTHARRRHSQRLTLTHARRRHSQLWYTTHAPTYSEEGWHPLKILLEVTIVLQWTYTNDDYYHKHVLHRITIVLSQI